MLYVGTRIQATSDGALAWWVKCALDGFALGCVPMWRAWNLPPLYSGAVRFEFEPQHGSGREDFAMPPDVFARGWGDCDDLIVARLAELISPTLPASFYSADDKTQQQALQRVRAQMGANKLPATRAQWQGEQLHVLIRFPDGRTEDPSLILGAPHQ